MKKITIRLNKKSIEQAEKEILRLKSIFPSMVKELLEKVSVWIIDKANWHLSKSDIGKNVIDSISNGWVADITPNSVKITNKSEKAVFVEFGVGIVGQSQSHPNATTEGYEYNMDSPYKDKKGSGTWVFQSKLADLDLPENNVEFAYNESNTDFAIVTRGAKGVWYAYNAIVDARNELAKSGGGEIGKMWNDIKARYIK